MSTQPEWLYYATFLIGATLLAGIYLAGLVVCLRRWHLGTAARLAGVGFGLLLIETVAVQLFQVAVPLLFGNDGSQTIARMAVFHSAMVLLAAAGMILVLLGFRRALADYALSRSILEPEEQLR